MFDSIFHGTPSSIGGQSVSSGRASLGVDVNSGTLYFRTPENGGWEQCSGIGGSVSSVFGRTGAVVASIADYQSLLLTGPAALTAPFNVTDSLGSSIIGTAGSPNFFAIQCTAGFFEGNSSGVGGLLTFNLSRAVAGGIVDFCLQNLSGNAAVYSTQAAPGTIVIEGGTAVNLIGNGSGTAVLNAQNFTVSVPVVAPTIVESQTLSPTSGATAGVTGQFAWDTTNLYVCTSGGSAGAATWKKVALSAD